MTFKKFQTIIVDYYQKYRRHMPWRETNDPYRILISEVMLQQTQVSRVMMKYEVFIKQFPTFQSLKNASLNDIMKVWSGMGYNRRALYLKKITEIVIEKYNGVLPKNPELLDKLPGIGNATAHAIAAFAFDYPSIFIETNIRRVFIHFFFSDKRNVDDKDILPLVDKTLDKKNPREWYYALMDYGTMLAKTTENPNKKSKHYSVQSKFVGSDRQIRGQILKKLIKSGPLQYNQIIEQIIDPARLHRILNTLQKEGLVQEKKGIYRIT